MASSSPLSSLVLPDDETKDLLECIKTHNIKRNPIKLSNLQRKAPFLFHLIRLVAHPHTSLPLEFHPWLDELWARASLVIPAEHTSEGSASTTECDFIKSLSFFPSLTKWRERGSYNADKATVRYTCRKLGKQHKNLLPGVITMHCRHGKGYF